MSRGFFGHLFLSLLLVAPGAVGAAPRIVAAAGKWAALSGAASCEAASLALLRATRERGQARASVAFDAPRGRRHGEFAALLSRVPRAGSSVILTIASEPFLLVVRGNMAWSRGPAQEAAIIAAMRHAGGMRIEARDERGGRIVDRYELVGAGTAIDAAAACASSLLK